MSDLLNVVILGASGFVGTDLVHLCLRHPNIKVQSLSANSLAGKDIKIEGIENIAKQYQLIEEIDFGNIDFIFNCLPNLKLHNLIKKIPSSIRIIDLSADFRLDNYEDYKQWYSFDHMAMKEKENFTYGLSEFKREEIKSSKHVSNPGCYATSVLVPLIPLVRKGLIKDNIIIDAKSGYSGAGKIKKTEDLLNDVEENIKTYGVGDHNHIAEINQEINKSKKESNIKVFFSANLIPVKRGILSNIYISQSKGITFEEIHSCLVNFFKSENFIKVLPLNSIPMTRDIVDTNNLIIGLKKGYKDDMFCIVSALDNLLKGAAGQAMQNFNIMNGYNESLGIE